MSLERHKASFDVVAVVGSQGAVAAAKGILAWLPPDFPAAVVYVQHRVATSGSILAELVRYQAALPVHAVRDGDPVQPGAIHVVPADAQTIVRAGRRFGLRDGRCTADPLLATVAGEFGARSIAVILSGRLSDGALGLRRVKQAGGRGLIQDPATAEAASMPLSAMATGCYDYVLPPRGIAEALVALVTAPGAAELLAVRSHPLAAVASM